MIYKNDLIGFLKEYQCKNSEVFDLIENHLKEKVYYYGDHFKTPTDKKNIWSFIHFVCLSLFRLFHNILVNSLQNFKFGASFDPRKEITSMELFRLVH